MTIDSEDHSVVTESPAPVPVQETVSAPAAVSAPPVVSAPAVRETIRTDHATTTRSAGGSEMTRRVVMLVFGLIQVVIVLRVVLLLLDAREANGLVSGILNLSQVFVAPFEGVLRTDALTKGGSIFDITAIVAIVGWTILELIILWAVGIFRRERA